jgi:hypothetical protein
MQVLPIPLPKIGRRKHTNPVAIGGIWMEELYLYPSTVLALQMTFSEVY